MIGGAEKLLTVVSQSHVTHEVKSLELLESPRFNTVMSQWDYRMKISLDDGMEFELAVWDHAAKEDAIQLNLDQTTYSYGPVDYLTISSNAQPIVRRDEKQQL